MTTVRPAARPAFADGALLLDGRPRFLLAGDYPYYRDHPRRWAPKLAALREAGIEVVTCYVPWRHHETTGPDGPRLRFDGDGNRDLAAFLDLIAAAGLLALPKPGPFVHAELPFGGLPDRLSPTLDPRRHPARSTDGRPLPYQQFTLPSVLDPLFLADATQWLHAVGRFLRPYLHPHGPVVAVQIGNEGHYGETALPIDALDRSRPAAADFARHFPGTTPPTGPPPATADPQPLVRWARWSADVLHSGTARLARALGPGLPVLTTCSPPARADHNPARAAGRYDTWLARNRIGAPTALPRAYTSWTGDVPTDDEALLNHVLAAKAGRGPNIEENWGLRWAGPGCAHPVVPVHHNLLGVACGATGITVYPACATTDWGEHLAVPPTADPGDPARYAPPYGDAAPVRADGSPGPAYAALQVLTHFLAGQQDALATSRPEPGVRWGIHPPYAAVGAWAWAGEPVVPPADRTLVPFATHCLRRNLPFHLAETTGHTTPDPADGPLVLVSGRFMERALQQRLARLAEQGHPLLLIGELPHQDERLRPCTELADAARRHAVRTVPPGATTVGPAVEQWLNTACPAPPRARPGPWLELRRTTTDPDDLLVFLFNRTRDPLQARTRCGPHLVTADLVAGGCAAVRVTHGRLGACYVKGLNERTGAGVPVRIRVGPDLLGTDRPCDLSALRGPHAFTTRTAAPHGRARVHLPDTP